MCIGGIGQAWCIGDEALQCALVALLWCIVQALQ